MKKPPHFSWFRLALVVAVILHAVSFGFSIARHGYLAHDSVQYLTLAENLARHGVWSQSYLEPYVPDVQRTPGYPVLIALLGRSPLLILLLQHVAVIGAGLMLVRVLRRMVGVKAARWGGALWMLQPYPILLSSVLLSEPFFLFFLVLCWHQWVRWHERHRFRHLAVGILALVAAAFIRPVAYPIALLASPLLVLSLLRLRQLPWRRRLPQMAVVVLVPLLAFGGWTYRNHAVTGRWMFNSMGDMGMIHARLGGLEALRAGDPWDEHHLYMAGDSVVALERGLPALRKAYTTKQNHETEMFGQGMTLITLKAFLSNPKEAIVFHTKAGMQLLGGVGYGWALMVTGNRWIALGLAGWQGLCNVLMYIAFVLALWRATRWPWPLRLGVVAAVVMLALSTVAWADGRYRMVADPAFVACLAWLLHRRWTRPKAQPPPADAN